MAKGTKDAQQRVYSFGGGHADGSAKMVELLGGKGANLAEMATLGLPVPPGFTITTDVCVEYLAGAKELDAELKQEIKSALEKVASIAGASFGDEDNPLLVSVRSGSRASMPGMMDTILNLGLNDATVLGLARQAGDERFAFDSYRRFIQMYADVVLGVDHGVFEDILENYRNLKGFNSDTELGAEDWRAVIDDYKSAIVGETGKDFPQDNAEQLWGAIGAVFSSWSNHRAVIYRQLHGIPEDWGTAVNVQAMVFGNKGQTSATGVAFTRNPSTGVKEIYGEYLLNAQGEDVVSGIRTPRPLTRLHGKNVGRDGIALEEVMPETFGELGEIFARLEKHYGDVQDIEFTIQDGTLWLLQTRSAKRTVEASIRIAVDLCREGVISRTEALMRVKPAGLAQLLHPTIDPDAKREIVTTGLPASPGAASGEIVLDSEAAEEAKSKGRDVILVRVETSPEDIHGMHAAVGILTARGGMTSHAAVVARGMGRPCVSGAGMMRIDKKAGVVRMGQTELKIGDVITIDGSSGQVLNGRAQLRQAQLSGAFGELMSWADEVRRLRVRTNADTAKEAELALKFGAEGIGLCRTEHMFFNEERILAMREMICALDEKGRVAALGKMHDMQRDDFISLFETMGERPVTIRLLDPPLHEFLPRSAREQAVLAETLGIQLDRLKARVAELSEFNPMLGFRGCRLAIRYPEVPRMQALAIFEAAIAVERERGLSVSPEIMIPLVGYRREFDLVCASIKEAANEVTARTGTTPKYSVGTMVELPRCALKADEIADGDGGAEFFSFGTNDLTQTTLGLSRDDAGGIIQTYTDNRVFDADPFVSLDQSGVGELIEMAVARGRRAKPGLKVGICGEHGGDPHSVEFFHDQDFEYVSCSPFRVPIARLAAAQANLTAAERQDNQRNNQ